jgi:Ca-activated chloride channel homolog
MHKNRVLLAAAFSIMLLAIDSIGSPMSAFVMRQDDDVVRVNSDLVVVNVTALTPDGKFAPGLKRNEFRLAEDGVAQDITGFSSEDTPFAAAILLDFSGSMESRVSLARSAAIRFLDGLREQDVAAVYRFDREVVQLQDFVPGRDLAPIAFEQTAKGMTVLNDAILTAAKDLGSRPEKRRAIIILSDGRDTQSSASASKALTAASAVDATIYAVDLSDPQDSRPQERMIGVAALKNFASKSGGRYVASPGGQALRDAFAGIVDELGHQYTLSYRSKNEKRDGKWRAIELKSSRNDVSLRARKGYYGPKA